MDTNTISLVSSIVSIIVTIVLGGLAIWLALYLFKLGNELQNTTKKMLADIEASARVTEFATKDVLKPTLDKVLSYYCLASSIRSLPVASSPNVTIELRLISRLILILSGQRISFSRCPAGERREP